MTKYREMSGKTRIWGLQGSKGPFSLTISQNGKYSYSQRISETKLSLSEKSKSHPFYDFRINGNVTIGMN